MAVQNILTRLTTWMHCPQRWLHNSRFPFLGTSWELLTHPINWHSSRLHLILTCCSSNLRRNCVQSWWCRKTEQAESKALERRNRFGEKRGKQQWLVLKWAHLKKDKNQQFSELSSNQTTGLCLHHFAMIQICKYLFSSNYVYTKATKCDSIINCFCRKPISRKTSHQGRNQLIFSGGKIIVSCCCT